MKVRSLVTIAMLLAAATEAGAAKRPGRQRDQIKVAIMDLKTSEQVPKELREALTALISQTLDELGPFKTISKADIDQMLRLEQMKDSLGCSDVSCLAEIGGALGADYMIGGSVVLVGGTYLTQLQLLNIKTARAEQRVSREYRGGPQGLLDEMRFAAKLAVRDLLAARSGKLRIDASEEGATVRIDGSIVGTTPLKPLTLSGGPHTVIVEREQFVRFGSDININENEEKALAVTLLPSEEFKKAYRGKALSTRVTACGLAGVGAAGIATGIGLLVYNQGNAAKVRGDTAAYNQSDTRSQADYDTLRSRQAGANVIDGFAIGAATVGVISAAVAVALFLTGDDPSKYDRAKTSTKANAAGAGVSVGLGTLSFALDP